MKILEGISDTGQSLLKKHLIYKDVNKGAKVLDKGDAISGGLFIMEGVLRVYTLGFNAKQATLYRINSGETCILALNSLFNNILYPAWVVAEEDTKIGILPGTVFRSLFSNETTIQDMTVQALSSTVFGLMNELENRHTKTVKQRLANYLLLRATSSLEIHRTQQNIADEIGSAREVVARLIAEFSDEGLLNTSRGKITLLNRPELNLVAQYEK